MTFAALPAAGSKEAGEETKPAPPADNGGEPDAPPPEGDLSEGLHLELDPNNIPTSIVQNMLDLNDGSATKWDFDFSGYPYKPAWYKFGPSQSYVVVPMVSLTGEPRDYWVLKYVTSGILSRYQLPHYVKIGEVSSYTSPVSAAQEFALKKGGANIAVTNLVIDILPITSTAGQFVDGHPVRGAISFVGDVFLVGGFVGSSASKAFLLRHATKVEAGIGAGYVVFAGYEAATGDEDAAVRDLSQGVLRLAGATAAQVIQLRNAANKSKTLAEGVKELNKDLRLGALELEEQAKALDDLARLNPHVIGAPHGFRDINTFNKFGADARAGLRAAGFADVEPILQGSAVTGKSFRTGGAFDVGRVSDFDVALTSPSMLAKAKALGIPLREGGTRTGPLTAADLEKLGLRTLASKLSKEAGREVNFMIFSSSDAAMNRAPSIVLPR